MDLHTTQVVPFPPTFPKTFFLTPLLPKDIFSKFYFPMDNFPNCITSQNNRVSQGTKVLHPLSSELVVRVLQHDVLDSELVLHPFLLWRCPNPLAH